MTQLNPRLLMLIAALSGVVRTAGAVQQPPDVVDSDAQGNTAMGSNVMQNLTTGIANTGAGYQALLDNDAGNNNSAFGYLALYNTVGSYNTAVGANSLFNDMTGSYTTAVGYNALLNNTTGSFNTGFGAYALPANTTGENNTAFGYAALRSTTTGNNNIGFGFQSLYQDTTGSNNIAMGYQSAYYVAAGSNTIEIGNAGYAADNAVIRIGTQGVHKTTVVAGIYGSTINNGSAVYVTSTGELGVQGSSERFKTAITPMGQSTRGLDKLRPVNFRYKTDASNTTQYGLIAEDVAKVYPELVIRDGSGVIQGVRYEELAPMLLNEMQKQQRTIADQGAQIRDLKKMVLQMQASLSGSQQKNELMAQR